MDFGELLAVSGASKPSVIILRLQPLTKDHIKNTFWKAWEATKSNLEQGAIFVLEKDKYKISNLPISR